MLFRHPESVMVLLTLIYQQILLIVPSFRNALKQLSFFSNEQLFNPVLADGLTPITSRENRIKSKEMEKTT